MLAVIHIISSHHHSTQFVSVKDFSVRRRLQSGLSLLITDKLTGVSTCVYEVTLTLYLSTMGSLTGSLLPALCMASCWSKYVINDGPLQTIKQVSTQTYVNSNKQSDFVATNTNIASSTFISTKKHTISVQIGVFCIYGSAN